MIKWLKIFSRDSRDKCCAGNTLTIFSYPSKDTDPIRADAHEKFLRALLHVIAGIIAAMTIIIAATIQSLGNNAAATGPVRKLYTLIFSELVMHLSAVLFFATTAAFVIQIFRWLNRLFKKRYNYLYSLFGMVIIVVGILYPSVKIANLAVCGSANIYVFSDSTGTSLDDVIGKLPFWLRGSCTTIVKNELSPPHKI